MRYTYQAGVIVPFAQRFYKQLIIVAMALFFATSAMLSVSAKAIAPPNWTVNAGSIINFSCGGIYVHTLDTVVQGTGGNFTGTGHYNPNASYTWNITGNIFGNSFVSKIVYTGTQAGSVYKLTNATINADGSANGTVDSNCQSFTMPAGSFSKYKIPKKEVDIFGNTGLENQKGAWMFNRDPSTSTPFIFTKAQSSLHKGSLYVKPISTNPGDKFIAEYFAKTKIAELSTFSYDFKVGAGSNAVTDAHQFYLNVYATFGSSDPNKYYDCRYDVVPTTSSGWTTVSFDPTLNYPVTTRGGTSPSPYACPASPADMDALSAGSAVRAFAINAGDSSASDAGLSGYLDKVVFTTTSKKMTYDFEPRKPKEKDDCKQEGWSQNLSAQRDFKNQGDCESYVNVHKQDTQKNDD
jgi:hypothetical protein